MPGPHSLPRIAMLALTLGAIGFFAPLVGAAPMPSAVEPPSKEPGQTSQPFHARPADIASRNTGWRARLLEAADVAEARLSTLLARVVGEPSSSPALPFQGVSLTTPSVHPDRTWETRPVENVGQLPSHLVLLIHGLDEPGSIWDELIPALHERSLVVARLDYPNDQSASVSADLLLTELGSLRARGVNRIDIVAHSMGGLITLDALTRQADARTSRRDASELPAVERLITLGTPFGGSPWARLRAISEIRDHLERWIASETRDPRALLHWSADGKGEAGTDLLPGSDYLTELLKRPIPPTFPTMTAVIARLAPAEAIGLSPPDLSSLTDSWLVRRVLGEDELKIIVDSLRKASLEVGDGVVPESSARAFPIDDTVVVASDHRSMIHRVAIVESIRRLTTAAARDEERSVSLPPAIPIIVDRLTRSPDETE